MERVGVGVSRQLAIHGESIQGTECGTTSLKIPMRRGKVAMWLGCGPRGSGSNFMVCSTSGDEETASSLESELQYLLVLLYRASTSHVVSSTN